jgi:hypothetical protein
MTEVCTICWLGRLSRRHHILRAFDSIVPAKLRIVLRTIHRQEGGATSSIL